MTAALLSASLCTAASTISRIEYYVDDDPGVGNGIALALTQFDCLRDIDGDGDLDAIEAAIEGIVELPVDIGKLKAGFHEVGVRAIDSALGPGYSLRLPLNVTRPLAIVGMECFIDLAEEALPGPGQRGTPLSVTGELRCTGEAMTPDFAPEVLFPGLAPGRHVLFVRARDNDVNGGTWGMFAQIPFWVSGTPRAVQHGLVFGNCEDPGEGASVRLVLTEEPDTVAAVVNPADFTGGTGCIAVYDQRGQSDCACVDLAYPPPQISACAASELTCPPERSTNVQVRWTAQRAFAYFDVELDGTIVTPAPLNGDALAFLIQDVPAGTHTVRVVGHRGQTVRYRSLPCEVVVPERCVVLSSVVRTAQGVRLCWTTSGGTLFDDFSVFRQDADTPLTTTTERCFLDTAPPEEEACYYVVAHLAGEPDCCSSLVCTAIVETFKRGDVNADGKLDIADAITLLQHLFAHGTTPSCRDAADANDDGKLDIGDAISILGHLFGGTGPLAAPFGACGEDPTPDALDCFLFSPCN